jgi:hypothetical protein
VFYHYFSRYTGAAGHGISQPSSPAGSLSGSYIKHFSRKVKEGLFLLSLEFKRGSIFRPLLGNIGKASTCHRQRILVKSKGDDDKPFDDNNKTCFFHHCSSLLVTVIPSTSH